MTRAEGAVRDACLRRDLKFAGVRRRRRRRRLSGPPPSRSDHAVGHGHQLRYCVELLHAWSPRSADPTILFCSRRTRRCLRGLTFSRAPLLPTIATAVCSTFASDAAVSLSSPPAAIFAPARSGARAVRVPADFIIGSAGFFFRRADLGRGARPATRSVARQRDARRRRGCAAYGYPRSCARARISAGVDDGCTRGRRGYARVRSLVCVPHASTARLDFPVTRALSII